MGSGIRGPGSGKIIPDPGVKKALDPGSRSATLIARIIFLTREVFSITNEVFNVGRMLRGSHEVFLQKSSKRTGIHSIHLKR
jgi:hypothetical protein